MKKIGIIILILLLSAIVFLFEFQDNITIVPNYYYQVYLDDEVLGVIESKDELEKYIDDEGSSIKEEYNVDKVYAPNGLQIKKIITYSNEVDSVKTVYNRLKNLKPFTISGYQFTINSNEEGIEKRVIYTTDEEIFEKAINNTIATYVGKSEYDAYTNETQEEITTTGVKISNVYIDEDIMVKSVKIPVTEKIYTDAETLSKYVLFETTDEIATYTVKAGDTIQKIADSNKIGVEAFLISNSDLTSADNILYTGQVVSVAVPKPAVTVMAEYTQVEDKVSDFVVEEKQDPTMNIGDEEILQYGEKGLNRVTSRVQRTNGEITYVQNKKTIILEPATSQIVLVGTRYQSNIGSLRWWAWPTNSGYSISSRYGYRTTRFSGYGFHQAVDIFISYGTPIYAANNGTVVTSSYSPARTAGGNGYGNYLVINHNNGYYTLYAHMSATARGIKVGSTVGRGQIIGYIGQTGDATGPHLHFETWVGAPWSSGAYHFNPLNLY